MTDQQTQTAPGAEDSDIPAVLLVDAEGNAVPPRDANLDPEGLKPGYILTMGKGKDKRHWRILEVEDADAAAMRVTIEPAKSTLRWTLLLLGILGVTWFVLDYLFDILFG